MVHYQLKQSVSAWWYQWKKSSFCLRSTSIGSHYCHSLVSCFFFKIFKFLKFLRAAVKVLTMNRVSRKAGNWARSNTNTASPLRPVKKPSRVEHSDAVSIVIFNSVLIVFPCRRFFWAITIMFRSIPLNPFLKMASMNSGVISIAHSNETRAMEKFQTWNSSLHDGMHAMT